MCSLSFSIFLGVRKGNSMMVSGSFCIPKDGASHPQGDDGHFICDKKQTIGLADGVSSWRAEEIDPGLYARELMNNSRLAILREPNGKVNPQKVLDQAFSKTKAQGSSTACIVTLQGDNMLHAVNIGDSGFRVIRQGAVIFKSPIQKHRHNPRAPYQLGNTADKPSMAMEIVVAAKQGDVIIAGTDGLFDNLSDSQILEATTTGIEQGLHPEQVAYSVAQQAYRSSISPVKQISGEGKIGGKPDDITVIISRILSTRDCF